jgi:hypothetical protein
MKNITQHPEKNNKLIWKKSAIFVEKLDDKGFCLKRKK